MNETVINDPEMRQVIVDLLKSRIDALSDILNKIKGMSDDDEGSEPRTPSPSRTIDKRKRKKNKAKPKYRYQACLSDLGQLLKKHSSLSTYRIRELLREQLDVSVTENALKKLLKKAQESKWIVLDETTGNWELPNE